MAGGAALPQALQGHAQPPLHHLLPPQVHHILLHLPLYLLVAPKLLILPTSLDTCPLPSSLITCALLFSSLTSSVFFLPTSLALTSLSRTRCFFQRVSRAPQSLPDGNYLGSRR